MAVLKNRKENNKYSFLKWNGSYQTIVILSSNIGRKNFDLDSFEIKNPLEKGD
ncbi:MAG: hypothetical protein IMZ40_00925 [Bacilli bacterium]|nr:hypothetical protein [Bacilli bacterium]